MPEPLRAAHNLAASDPAMAERVRRVIDLIEGYEGLYGLELLASVHWAAKHDLAAAGSVEAARSRVQEWSERKKARYQPDHIEAAWRHLSDQGWIGVGSRPQDTTAEERETA